MALSLSVDVDGHRELDLSLSKLGATVTNLEKHWPKVADVFYEIELDQFLSEGARTGRKWAPLTRAYSERKQLSQGGFASGDNILRLTDALKRSLTERGDSQGVYDSTPDSLTLGTTDPKALFHQRGTDKMAARPPIELIGKDAKKLRAAFADGIQKDVRNYWQNPVGVGITSLVPDDFYDDPSARLQFEMDDQELIELGF